MSVALRKQISDSAHPGAPSQAERRNTDHETIVGAMT